MSYCWLQRAAVDVAHTQSLARWGGLRGVRDSGAIASALARPEELAADARPERRELATLAAAHLHGLASAHGFVDGNKRTAWLATRMFLAINAQSLHFDPADALSMVMRAADGSLSEPACAQWFRARLR
jgi:death-on-curing protein